MRIRSIETFTNAGPYVEFSVEPADWTDGLFTPALEAHDGRVAIPSGPGWGVAVSPEWLAGAERAVSGTVGKT